jgi:hypothetical protein
MTPLDQVEEILYLADNTELSYREIADKVLGSKSKQSTVGDIVRRYRVDPVVGYRPDKYNGTESHSGASMAYTEGYFEKTRKAERSKDNSRILLISDLHIPYHHPDALEFLQHLKDKYKPTRVICGGDELDKHALSYHDSDPDLPSAGDELRASLPTVAKLERMFPEMDILESNHGSLVWRKAKTHGIPRHYIKSYQDVLGVGEGWLWHFDMTLQLPNGQCCYLHHGKVSDVLRLSQQMGMNAVQFHYHERFKVDYWGNSTGLYWALQSGCLIDDDSYAFNYNNVNLKRPILGTTLIIDSQPILVPMLLDSEGRWKGRAYA